MSDYITIPISKTGKHAGKHVAIVDSVDAELKQLSWSLDIGRKTYYARTRIKGKSFSIHRMIMREMLGRELLPIELVDHINGNGLDNRRENLRVVTNSQNLLNRGKTVRNKSGYKGVYWFKPHRKWTAEIRVNGKKKRLGYFKTPELAYEAYCKAAIELHGEFANIGSENAK